MSAVQEIEAAIKKLTDMKARSQGDIWYRSIRGISAHGGEFGANPEGIVDAQNGRRSMHTSRCTPVDADLIVTLHRTIDAQLAILNLAIAFAAISPNRHTDAALDLARAINGPTA